MTSAAAIILRRAADAVKIEQRALFAESEDLLERATRLGALERRLRDMATEAQDVVEDEKEAQKWMGPGATVQIGTGRVVARQRRQKSRPGA